MLNHSLADLDKMQFLAISILFLILPVASISNSSENYTQVANESVINEPGASDFINNASESGNLRGNAPVSMGGETRIIDINVTYDQYGYNGVNRFTSNDGLTYEFDPRGDVRIYGQINELIGAYGLGISSTHPKIPTSLFKSINSDFLWSWNLTSETVLENGTIWNQELNNTENVTYRYKRSVITGKNDDVRFDWSWRFEFTPHKDVKINATFTNNLGYSNFFKIWFINYLEADDSLIYDGVLYKPQLSGTTTIPGDDKAIPVLHFNRHTFNYLDVIESGYNITHVIYGKDTYFNTGKLVFMTEFLKKAQFGIGETWSLDPLSTGYKSPTRTDDPYCQWTNGNNVFADDGAYATEITKNDACVASRFDFAIPDDATIDGIAVKIDARIHSLFPPVVRGGANLTINLNWDNLTSPLGTSEKQQNWGGTIDITEVLGNSTDTWGRTWTPDEFNNDSKFRLHWNFTYAATSGLNTNDFNPGVDLVQVNVFYSVPPLNITFVSPTSDNNTDIGSTFIVNATTNRNATLILKSNHTGVDVNYTMTRINPNLYNAVFWGYDGINDGTHISYTIYGNDSYNESNQTETRIATVVSEPPSLTLNSPANDSTDPALSRLLNWTVADNEGDLMEVYVFGGNTSSFDINHVLYSNEDFDGTYTMNWSNRPINPAEWNGLYAVYHLDEIQAFGENESFVVDGTGRNNGTMYDHTGSGDYATNVDGYMADAYDFDGLLQSIRVGQSSTSFSDVCNTSTGCTFCAWVNRTSTDDVIMAKSDSSGEAYFRLYASASGTTFFKITKAGDVTHGCYNTLTDGGFIPLNQWSFVCGVYNRTHIIVYTNGSRQVSKECTDFDNVNNWTGNEWLTIGAWTEGAQFGAQWHGGIDEVSIWNRSLSDAEIAELNSTRLSNGTWYWNVTAYDSPNGLNESRRQFTIGLSTQTCQNLNTANEYYQMFGDVTDHAQSCFNITADNVTLDCAGYTLDGIGTGNGVNISNSAGNVTTINCLIQEFSTGISVGIGSHDSKVINNTITTNYGIYSEGDYDEFYNNTIAGVVAGMTFKSADGNIIINNSVSSTINDAIIFLGNSDSNILRNNTFSAGTGVGDYGVLLAGTAYNNTFSNSYISGYYGAYYSAPGDGNNFYNSTITGVDNDVYITSSEDNIFLNCSYNSESVNADSELIRQWYIRANVTIGGAGTSANVTFENKTGDKIGTNQTSDPATGLTPWVALTEYKNVSGTTLRWTNYTVNATKTGYTMNSTSFNFTNNIVVNVSMNLLPSNPCDLTPNQNNELDCSNNCIYSNGETTIKNLTLTSSGIISLENYNLTVENIMGTITCSIAGDLASHLFMA